MSVSRERRRIAWPIVGALAVGVVVVLAAGMYLYDRAHRHTIAAGVKIDGVSVGGLGEGAALAKVQSAVIDPLKQPLTVATHGQSWTLDPGQARLRVDARAMVARAVQVSREGSIVTRTFRGVFGGSLNRNVPLAMSYSHREVSELTAQVRAAVDRPAQNASVLPNATGLGTVPARPGRVLEGARLEARIEHALTAALASRTVGVPTRALRPKITTKQLAAEYPAYIVIDRPAFRLRFYEHLKLTKSYEIAVGMEGLETPPGPHKIEWKQVDPPWYVPDKAWAGSLAGTVVPPGPEDPLKARFMSFDGGAGIHGIDPSEYESIGHDASHGCVRMRIPDVIALYSRTPVGTPVYIL